MSDRNPTEDCTDERCPFVSYPHSVELVPNTNVRVHYTVDPQKQEIVLLWIHGDDQRWPDEAERQQIRDNIEAGTLSSKPWKDRDF